MQRGNTLPARNRKRNEVNVFTQNLRPCKSISAARKNKHTTHVVAFTAMSLLYVLSCLPPTPETTLIKRGLTERKDRPSAACWFTARETSAMA